jgi:hypothetical protein
MPSEPPTIEVPWKPGMGEGIQGDVVSFGHRLTHGPISTIALIQIPGSHTLQQAKSTDDARLFLAATIPRFGAWELHAEDFPAMLRFQKDRRESTHCVATFC